ncbi:PA14 domain-containing protein [Sulfuriroseicoccus oceanibius]|uniref:PA14 domain-containing protein n=1 Tax=Sulfuriroseicoccus oceanibius TaxID=2707525 RepID=A0A6B3L6X7_9BACT|nr:PA14 domain-containing protein [Sulfuriroseicoccus oceanibius]QQL43818.1 hypothetical protein G3M56_007895 [Sulfuriroseicoccus oceanibius]
MNARLLVVGALGAWMMPVAADEVAGMWYERWDGVMGRGSLLEFQQSGISRGGAMLSGGMPMAQWFGAEGQGYGVRVRGVLTVPITGDYTFFVAGRENVALWLSSDGTPFEKRRIGYTTKPTGVMKWGESESQRSEVVRLDAGQRYFIEAQMVDAAGGGHLEVGWAYEEPREFEVVGVGTALVDDVVTVDRAVKMRVEGGDIWGTADDFGFASREMVGDGEIVACVGEIEQAAAWAKMGLMLRGTTDTASPHAMVAVTGANGTVFQRRREQGAESVHTGVAVSYPWLKLVRRGDEIAAYGSVDQKAWREIGRDTIPGLPDAVRVGVAGTNNNGENALAVDVSGIEVRPAFARQVIPRDHLALWEGSELDGDDDGLPDAWEVANGLDPLSAIGVDGEYGDPDLDGRNNGDEYRDGSDPLAAEATPGGLTLERWEGLPGQRLEELTAVRERFLREPTERAQGAQVNARSHGDDYGTRYRGTLSVPLEGEYEFWIAGDDEVELWLADGTVVVDGVEQTGHSGKRRIAWVRDEYLERNFTEDEDFERYPNQYSGRIHLKPGRDYYIEVLHKQGRGPDHVALAWRTPGGARELVPADVLWSYIGSEQDADDDFLPDAWELEHGLSPNDNGLSDVKDGERGDADGDGLTNLQEYQLGTNPMESDTDGDSLSDSDEIDFYGSDPLVSDAVAATRYAEIDLTSEVDSDGLWKVMDDGTLQAYPRRGWIDYPVEIRAGDEGVYELRIRGGVSGQIRSVEELPLVISLDDEEIGREVMRCVDGEGEVVRVLTPWLEAGVYTVRLRNTNYRADVMMRLDGIGVYQVGGVDLDGDGKADWMKDELAVANRITSVAGTSYVSPAFVEGITSHLGNARMLKLVGDDVEVVSLERGVDGGFYTMVDLVAQRPVNVDVSFLNGALHEQHQIEWVPLNVIETPSITVAKGDALMLSAWLPGHSEGGWFSMTRNGSVLTTADGIGLHVSGVPLIERFDSVGKYEYAVTWAAEGGTASVNGALTVNVVDADFGDGIDVQAWQRESWVLEGMRGLELDPDDALVWYEESSSDSGPRRFVVDIYEVGTRYVVARIPETGRIVGRGEVRGFYVANEQETADAQLFHVGADGTRSYRFTLVADGLPDGYEIHLKSYYQGTVFEDGGNHWVLTNKDFNSIGVVDVIMQTGPDGDGRLCHTVRVVAPGE